MGVSETDLARGYTREQKARRAIYMKAWAEKNKEKLRADSAKRYISKKLNGTAVDYHRKRLYGIGAEEYKRLLMSQDSKCAACERQHDPSKKKGSLHVDHDHSTGRIRGLICGNCNSALGYLGDDPAKAFATMYRYAVKTVPERMAG